ncbi:putative methyltransferase FkbM [Streptomyces sp. Tu6071]|nr:FkbM family methyltransferase [Streptomyces sp. Tu6071]EGJ76116.1 putative methyltransferase FkbM [Streptomyces sp. Tu6071]
MLPHHGHCRTRAGCRFAVDTRDLIQRYIYMFGMWEPNLTKWLSSRLKPGDVFVDVGANIGYFSALGARLVGPGGAVVSVEASPPFADLLRANLRLNRADNVRVVEQAVSDREETLTLVLASSANMGANSIVPYDGPIEARHEVPASPLASLLTEDEVRRARVIKVDVEGAEGKAVRGLAPFLGKLRPDAEVTVEVTPSRMAELGDSAAELLGTMAAAGFHPYRLPNDYSPGSYPAAIRAPLPPLRRLRGDVNGESDLIFSRVDADVLP